jgi:uncharacterized protein (DUF983 family)
MTPAPPSPFLAGILARCPSCGKGKLYARYLRFAPQCPACGVSFAKADVGDGAAVFTMFIVGAIVVPLAFILQFAFGWQMWGTLTVTCAATVALCLWLLPTLKALLFTLQFKHTAAEGHLVDP